MNSQPNLSWLILGAAVGLIAAAYGILRQDSSMAPLPDTAIARVNGTLISREIYERVLGQSPIDEENAAQARAALLDNLISEELLLQRGIELGMAESDSAVRAAIIGSLVASVTAEADAANPSDEELSVHLSAYSERFSFTSRIAVSAWQTDDEKAAQAFADSLRVAAETPVPENIDTLPDLPNSLQAIETLRDHLGPGITATAANMPVNSSAVFARRGQWLIIQVNEQQSEAVVDLDRIRNRVLLDYRRQLADDSLSAYIDSLRQRADIDVVLP